MGQEGKGWPLQLLVSVLSGAALPCLVDPKPYMTMKTRWFSLVIHLAESLGGGRLQRGSQREGIPTERGAAVRQLQTHCLQSLFFSFSLGKSTCNVPCRGNTVNFAIKLLKLIFSGYDIAAALL